MEKNWYEVVGKINDGRFKKVQKMEYLLETT
jgi:hypothetical protein